MHKKQSILKHLHCGCILLSVLLNTSLFASIDGAMTTQQPEVERDNKQRGRHNESMHQLIMIERFLDMPPERLAEIRATLERVEAMSPEEKDAMRKRIAEFRRLPPEKRHKISQALENIPEAERRKIHAYWKSMSPEERRKKREAFQNMSPEERAAWREKIINENSE